jgi:replicative DNA helicase
MSKEIKDKAKEYLKAKLSVIPTKETKQPALRTWKPYQTEVIKEDEVEDLFNKPAVKGIAIICGAISGGLEVIDVDTKYDTTGTLWEELNGLLQDNLPKETYNKLVIAQTKSGGYHIYYRCSSIAGNLKLSFKENKEVLVETRGEGGYVVAPPTEGYKYLQGNPTNIATITPPERDLILTIGRSFNEIEEEVKSKKETSARKPEFDNSTGLSPMEDYNNRGDVVSLLESNGWKVVNTRGARVNVLRPGETDSKTSGNFHTVKRTLRVFSSSTDFDTAKAYNPYQVFELLEANGEWREAYKKLLELGYGESNKPEDTRRTLLKATAIDVTIVNPVNKETSVISKTGENLKVEELETAIGEEAIITITKEGATDEVLKAIEELQRLGKRIYIKEGETEERDYTYQLEQIFKKYGAIEEDKGKLSARDIDSLLDEVIIVSSNLQPIDKGIFLKEFTDLEEIKQLGISEESLSITVDRLTSTRDKEAQATQFKELLKDAQRLQDKGDTDKALDILNDRVKDLKLKDKATEFSSLIIPVKEEELKDRQANKPESINSGYTIGGEELLLPSGALSVFSAPTSHGKTTFLINLSVNVAKHYPDKEIYLFSYEEDRDSILINTLNTFLDKEISSNNRRSLKSYFSTGSQEYIKYETKQYFKTNKARFFKEFIDTKRLNINYTSYDSDTLTEAIRYLHKNANVGAIFIDYIQLLNLAKGKYKTYSRQEEIKEICIALKDVAVETGLPIILGAQFNRTVVNQLHLHPTKLGEAGDIERIANLIVGFWNNNFKPIATEGELNQINQLGATTPDTIYTEILKNRGGKVGLKEILSFNGNTATIKNQEETPEEDIF